MCVFSDLSYIAKAGAQVFEVMSAVDSQAIWYVAAPRLLYIYCQCI